MAMWSSRGADLREGEVRDGHDHVGTFCPQSRDAFTRTDTHIQTHKTHTHTHTHTNTHTHTHTHTHAGKLEDRRMQSR